MFRYFWLSFVVSFFHSIELIDMKMVSIGDYSQEKHKLNEPNCGQSFITNNNDLNHIKTCFLSPYESEMFGESSDEYHSEKENSAKNNRYSKRIFKGSDAKFGQSPFTVLILKTNVRSSSITCTGALISFEWVLTAAHCLIEDRNQTDPNKPVRSPDQIRVIIGLDSNHEVQRRSSLAYSMHKHPQYILGNLTYDIGLIKVNRPFDKIFDSRLRINPICLPEKNWVNTERMNATIFGWGLMERNIEADVLQTAQIIIQPFDICSYEMFCSMNYSENSPRPCSGDSGGPLVLYDDRSPVKKAILIGIYAGAMRQNTDCSHENVLENYWVAVPNIMDWILNTIRENS